MIMLTIGFSNCFAQETLVASGGDETGSNGSIAYSVGQLVYNSSTGSNGSIVEGIQQVYEVSEVLSSLDFLDLSKNLKVSPNPSTDMLKLSMENTDDLQLNYVLIDSNGKVVKKDTIYSNETDIYVANLPSSTYFLKIINQQKEVKVFKVIKK